jgi:hypothetical protein
LAAAGVSWIAGVSANLYSASSSASINCRRESRHPARPGKNPDRRHRTARAADFVDRESPLTQLPEWFQSMAAGNHAIKKRVRVQE